MVPEEEEEEEEKLAAGGKLNMKCQSGCREHRVVVGYASWSSVLDVARPDASSMPSVAVPFEALFLTSGWAVQSASLGTLRTR